MTPARDGGLDSLRGLAALMVVFYHLNLLGCGWLGVQLFFVLSGYFITRQWTQLEPAGARPALRIFLARRALRLLPLYLFYLLGLALLARSPYAPPGLAGSLAADGPSLLSASYNLQAAQPAHRAHPWLAHLWSISVELQLYALWPLLLLAARGRGRWLLLGGLVLAGPVLRASLAAWADPPLPARAALVGLSTVSHLDAFALGGLLALAGPAFARRAGHGGVGLALALALWLAGAAVNGPGLLPRQTLGAPLLLGHPNGLPLSGQWIWGYSGVNLLAGWAILALQARQGLAPLRWVGERAYGVYLFHLPLAHLVAPLVLTLHQQLQTGFHGSLLLLAPPYLAVLLLLAGLSYRYLERPWWRLRPGLPEAHRAA